MFAERPVAQETYRSLMTSHAKEARQAGYLLHRRQVFVNRPRSDSEAIKKATPNNFQHESQRSNLEAEQYDVPHPHLSMYMEKVDVEASQIKPVEILSYRSLVSHMQIAFWFQKLKEKFVYMQGLTNPKNFTYDDYSVEYWGEFVNILFINSSHWVCVSNFQCEPNEINIYDSLDSINAKNISEIGVDLKKMNRSARKVNIKAVQQQKNLRDCGLFSLAFAHSICYREDPAEFVYDDSALRAHFNSCAMQDKIHDFPRKVSNFDLYLFSNALIKFEILFLFRK
jgi:hypothetical protein